jgi:hypothetical protein
MYFHKIGYVVGDLHLTLSLEFNSDIHGFTVTPTSFANAIEFHQHINNLYNM